MKLPDIESSPESVVEGDDYSGAATFLYSSKITENVSLEGICEILSESKIFSFALASSGRIYFKKDDRLISQQLIIEPTITEQGMHVSGYHDFIRSNPGDSNVYALSLAFDLLLSDKKLFNSAYGFPTESARIFMRPIAIKCEGDEEYELIIPYVRVYKGGVISLSFPSVAGFSNLTVQRVVRNEVNKSRTILKSMLCERDLHLACSECQIAQMSRWDRLSQRRGLEVTMDAALASPEELVFAEERLTVYELVHTDKLTITDMARNLFSMVARAISSGAVQARIKWYGGQYKDISIGEHWRGKPIIFINTHANQKSSASENWSAHNLLVSSVMTRTVLTDDRAHVDLSFKDLRGFDDFNNFYSEPVSLVLASSQVEAFAQDGGSYTFNNLRSDIQVLNEAAHFIQTYYSYASLGLDKCNTAVDVARLELDIRGFEETLLSSHKYGEIAGYIKAVQGGNQLTAICTLLHKKIETVRTALELDDKIKSESYTRRITIVFGIIASATLSPELMQPFARYINLAPANEDLAKIYGIGASVVVVTITLVLSHYIFRLRDWIVKALSGR